MKYLLSLIIILSNFYGFCQKSEVLSLSLEDAIAMAKQKNTDILNAYLDIKYAQHQVTEVLSNGLPQINGSADFNHTFEIPTQIIPGDFVGQPGTTIAAQFGVPFNVNAAVGVNQLLFDGTFFLGLKASSEFVKISKLSSSSAEIDVKEAVCKAYYMVLIAEQNLNQLQSSYQNMMRLKSETEAMYKAGFAEQLDVDRIGLALSNLDVNLTRVKNQTQLTQQLLLNTIGININQNIKLTTPLPSEVEESVLTSNFDPNNRIEIKLLDQQQLMNELDLKRFKVGYMPSLYGNFSYGSSTFGGENKFSELGTDWYGNGRYGVGLKLPLFDGLYKKSKIDQAKIKIKKTENTRSQALRGINLELNQSKNAHEEAKKTLQLQKRNKQLAEDIYQTTSIKFKEGVGSSFEMVTADNEFTQAKINYLNALYQLNIAHINLQKAFGIL
jgi:outer membrane protein